MPGIAVLSITVGSSASSQLRHPFTPSVIAAVAVETMNVLFPVTGATINGPRGCITLPKCTNTLAGDPLYLHRINCMDAVQVKVSSVPLQTSVPASLDSSTAAETERNSRTITITYSTLPHAWHALVRGIHNNMGSINLVPRLYSRTQTMENLGTRPHGLICE